MIKKCLIWSSAFMLIWSFFGLSWAAEPIKIGMPTPLTGAYASDGVGYQQGIEFAVDEINFSGGLLGKPLKIVKFDIADFAPERLIQAADKLVRGDKVDSVHGGWSGWGQDVKAFGKYEVPFLMVDASITAVSVIRENLEEYSNCFQLTGIEKDIAVDVFDMMEQLPYEYQNKKIALIVAEDSWGQEMGLGIESRAKEKGWEVSMHEIVPYGTMEWAPILTKIRSQKPALIHVEILSPPDVITFFRQFMRNPTKSLINYGYGLMPPGFIKNMGKEANGLMGFTLGIPIPEGPTHASDKWLREFRDKYGNYPMSGGYAAYIGVMWWAEAVTKIGSVKEYKAINEYIAHNSYYDKLTDAVWRFDEDHKIQLTAEVPTLHYQVQDGELVTVFTGRARKYLGYQWQLPPWIKK